MNQKLLTTLLCWVSVTFLLLITPIVWSHEGHDHSADRVDPAPAASQLPPAMLLPAIEGPKPWSNKPLLNDPDRFQFAIMTDRTGGHRPGVWMDAVRKLNLLRPEFVVSVGDLIEGYTEDENRLASEWAEFLGFIDQLQMRFFFVAGNHDLTNPVMHRLWRERFGPEWYSFDYKNVHFVCLCSEDPVNKIGEKQLEFLKKDLDANQDARWTLVFVHKPLWTYAEAQIAERGKDRTNWKRVEAMLVDRPHTVFAGHVHHYVQYERNGNEYYSLATTGGGSSLRGNQYGEFDHVTWLTMEPSGPQVVNLRLDGILPPDVSTEESIKRVEGLLSKVQLEISPIMIQDANGFEEGVFTISMANELSDPVEVTGTVDGLPLRGLLVDPEQIRLVVGPGGSAEQTLRVRFSEEIEFASLRRATFKAKVQSKNDEGEKNPLVVDRSIPLIIDRLYECPQLAKRLVVDCYFDSKEAAWHTTPEIPLVIGESQDWKGPNDGSFSLKANQHKGELFLSIRVTDERVLAGVDKMELILDARSKRTRKDHSRLRGGITRIMLTAPDKDGKLTAKAMTNLDRNKVVEQPMEAVAVRTAAGWDVELALPAKALDSFQDADWTDFQLSAIYSDVDEPDAKPSDIIWRGSRSVRDRNTNYGVFERGE